MAVEDIRAKLAAATAAVEAAQAKGDEDAELRAIDAEDAARAELQAEQARSRKLVLKRAERDARKSASGAYSVEGMDMASLLPDANPEKIPGGGIVVLRSHTAASKKEWDATVGTNAAMAAANTDLVCANVIRIGDKTPGADGKWDEATALSFRTFLEGDLGSGMPNQLGAKVLALGGARADETKRSSK